MLEAILTVGVLMAPADLIIGERSIKDCMPTTIFEHLDEIEEGLRDLKVKPVSIAWVCKMDGVFVKGTIVGEPV